MNAEHKIITTYKTLIAAGFAGVVGLGLLWATTYFDWFNHHSIIKSLVRDVGSLLVAAIAVTVIWELAGKRAFLDEVLSSVRISENLRQAGILETFFDFATIRWNELFAGVTDSRRSSHTAAHGATLFAAISSSLRTTRKPTSGSFCPIQKILPFLPSSHDASTPNPSI